MKIDPIKAAGIYDMQIKSAQSKNTGAADNTNEKKVDRIEISKAGSELSQKVRLNAKIADEIEKPASAERIAKLREQIKNGTYRIPAELIADKMINSK